MGPDGVASWVKAPTARERRKKRSLEKGIIVSIGLVSQRKVKQCLWGNSVPSATKDVGSEEERERAIKMSVK